MMKKNLHLLYILSLLLSPALQAQTRRMALLDVRPSASSAGFGAVGSGAQQGAYVFTNPAALYTTDGSQPGTTCDYNLTIIDNGEDHSAMHTLSAARRQGNYVWMAGAGYFDQGRISRVLDADMQVVDEEIRVRAATFISGVAGRLPGGIVVYGTLGLAAEQLTTAQNAYFMGLGAARSGSVGRWKYTGNIGVSGLGFLTYNNRLMTLAPQLCIGGSATTNSFVGRQFALYAEVGYYFSDGASAASCALRAGAACSLGRNLQVRVGGKAEKNHSTLSAGLGIKWHVLCLNLSAEHGYGTLRTNTYWAGTTLTF